MGTDPFEEFEFKPITDGLGFHPKKSEKTKSLATDHLQSRGIDFLENQTHEQDPFKAPLPRRESKRTSVYTEESAPTLSPVDDILQTLQKNRRLEIELDRKHRQELSQQKTTAGLKATGPQLSPMILDGMLITAASLLCMIIMLMTTKVDLLSNLSNPDTQGMIYLSTFALLATVSFIYFVTQRVFLGYTPGEWAYDMQLGQTEKIGTATYTGQVVLRQILLTMTGFILLPLIGWLSGTDWLGKVTGASLFVRN